MKYLEVTFSITASPTLLQDARDVLAALCGDVGFESFVDCDGGLIGYIQKDLFDPDALRQAVECFPITGATIRYTVADAEYKDWNQQWESQGFQPVVIGNCVIHDGRHLPSDADGKLLVVIDARQAFGTGLHPTTRMMVETLMTTRLNGKQMLDCGCGTGILSIVALKRGAALATAFDIDEWSVDNTLHNAILNKVDNNLRLIPGDISKVPDGNYDIVAANINRNILIDALPRISQLSANGAIIMLSGFYADDVTPIHTLATSLRLTLLSHLSSSPWQCLIYRHP